MVLDRATHECATFDCMTCDGIAMGSDIRPQRTNDQNYIMSRQSDTWPHRTLDRILIENDTWPHIILTELTRMARTLLPGHFVLNLDNLSTSHFVILQKSYDEIREASSVSLLSNCIYSIWLDGGHANWPLNGRQIAKLTKCRGASKLNKSNHNWQKIIFFTFNQKSFQRFFFFKARFQCIYC